MYTHTRARAYRIVLGIAIVGKKHSTPPGCALELLLQTSVSITAVLRTRDLRQMLDQTDRGGGLDRQAHAVKGLEYKGEFLFSKAIDDE